MTSISENDLRSETAKRFPELTAPQIEKIEKSGSTSREFYRLRGSERALIVVHYSRERAENSHYVEIARFLERNGIHGPKIHFHDEANGLIWMEDLGAIDLWSYRGESWEIRRPLYQAALTEVTRLHQLPAETVKEIAPDLQPEFDEALYRWEQEYFFENALGVYFGIEEKKWRELAALPALQQIAAVLGGKAKVLVHRDFQSQNILMRGMQPYLIDFQGMRLGRAEYDLASLFLDPYVTLSAAERAELFDYCGQAESETFGFCAMQRLMQALGAYGFLGVIKGNKQFLQHIPAAMNSLREIIAKIDGLQPLQSALAALSL